MTQDEMKATDEIVPPVQLDHWREYKFTITDKELAMVDDEDLLGRIERSSEALRRYVDERAAQMRRKLALRYNAETCKWDFSTER